jgi:hypothetical protein
MVEVKAIVPVAAAETPEVATESDAGAAAEAEARAPHRLQW